MLLYFRECGGVLMSNFNCEHCGTAIIDSPRGYITSCEHYKVENIARLHEFQVDVPQDFMFVLNELASINIDVNE